MASPCKEDGNNCGHKNPPFFSTLHKAESENKEEYSNSSHIHRTSSKWLRSPVQRHMLQGLFKVWLAGSFKEFSCLGILVEGAGRRTSIEVRNEEIWHFLDTVRPCSRIVKVQAFCIVTVAIGRQLRAASHGVWSVFVCRNKFIGICRNSYATKNEEQC